MTGAGAELAERIAGRRAGVCGFTDVEALARFAAGRVWKDTGRALVTEGIGGQRASALNDLAGVDRERFDRAVDQTFGPSPEERARQQRDGGES
ncbi:hypothetical protein [Streptomyces sp. NPDC001889]